MLKIALWNNHPSGGGKRALYEIASGLKKRGHYLESWCPPTAHRDYLPLASIMPENVVPYDNSAFQQRYKWEALAFNCLKFKKQLSAMEEHCKKCADAINKKGFDIFYSANCLTFAVPPIAKYINCKRVIYHQEPKRNLHEARPKLPWVAAPKERNRLWPYSVFRQYTSEHEYIFSKRLELREEVDSLEAFDMIFVNSAFSRENILRCFNLDSKVCYLGINTDLFRPLGLEREHFVIGVGGLQGHKGIDLAVRAIGSIPLEHRPKLVWVGNLIDEKFMQDVEELAAKLEVRFESKLLIPDTELVDLLNRASVFLYTSHLEPFGFAPLEANACGTPVVAVAEGGVRETVQSGVNGILVPDRAPLTLGRAVSQLLQDRSLATQMGKNGIDAIFKLWTWDSCVDRLEAELFRLLEKND